MKKFVITSILLAFFATGSTLMAQNNKEEYLGLPGDNLNLYAVMKLFQQSKTLEEFERNLNDPKTNINNLDLNGDNLVDYIKVYDDVDGDVHNIVLQVAVGPKENQDVAVFTVQRFDNGQVQIQLTGDEELYGKNYIVEPIFDNETAGETPNPGYTGNNRTTQSITYIRTTPVEISGWPLVRFIYMPSYTVWHSPWYWGYNPTYWHPWNPFSWHYYYGYHYYWNNDYYAHYRRWDYHRYSRWNDFYYASKRSYSPDVNHRIESGTYKATYSHPDQRKEGEAFFAKAHPEEYRRNTISNSQNNATRRSDTQIRSTESPNGNKAATTRRSTTTVTSRPVSNPNVVKSSETTRKTTTVTNKSVVNHPVERNDAVTRRSSSTVVNKSITNSGTKQNVQNNKNSGQQKSTTVTSANRRADKKNKDAATVKKENPVKDPDNNDSNRRK